jgi:hypothetical protein
LSLVCLHGDGVEQVEGVLLRGGGGGGHGEGGAGDRFAASGLLDGGEIGEPGGE